MLMISPPETVTSLPNRYPSMPFGIALARNRMPSSRSTVSSWAMLSMP